MAIEYYLIDAFSNDPFTGCPAVVCPLDKWPSDDLLQKMTNEHNQSETAFYVPKGGRFELRWFTVSGGEIDLCGHATMAAAHVIFEKGYSGSVVEFQTRFSGDLRVMREDGFLTLDFPAWKVSPVDAPLDAAQALGREGWKGVWAKRDYLFLFEDEDQIRDIRPDFGRLKNWDRWVCVTARGKECDFVSRFFCAGEPLEEDPVTGSAHSMLTPFWAERLGKEKLLARQLSSRGGELKCESRGDRVWIGGRARTYAKGLIHLEF
jgi:PhzF family phenazine biosynthesis protein